MIVPSSLWTQKQEYSVAEEQWLALSRWGRGSVGGRPVHVTLVVDEVVIRQTFIQALQFHSAIIIKSELHIICISVTDTI